MTYLLPKMSVLVLKLRLITNKILHELILGAQGVSLSAALKSHVERVEEHNKALRIKEAAIPSDQRGQLTVEAFCALPFNPNIQDEIELVERNLAAAQAADKITTQADFKSLSLPSFDLESIESILQTDLPGLEAQAAANVQEHISKLGTGGEAWVNRGMQKVPSVLNSDEFIECPFCRQDLNQSGIIAHYQLYFGSEYENLKERITIYKNSVDLSHSSEVQSAFERSANQAFQTFTFWEKFTQISSFSIDTAEIARAWKAVREPIIEILLAKQASPLEKMSISAEIRDAWAIYEQHRQTIQDLSSRLTANNTQIALVKESAAAGNVSALIADRNRLTSIRSRHSESTALLCQNYLEEKADKKRTEALRDNARKALDDYRSNIFGQYEESINHYLTRFYAGFRLTSVSSQNHRGGSSCTYSVLINNVNVPLISDNGASFKNTLSAGDRNTLALAFFFATLEHDPLLSQKIVVIDDPMTSLDEHRTLATIQEIRGLTTRVKQVIVLSHSKPFLCQLWENSDRANRSALHILRGSGSSFIDVWDVHQDCISEHDKRHALIQSYIQTGNNGKERETATALRYVLEAFMRIAYPEDFIPGALLGPFHEKCRNALTAGNQILNQTDTVELRNILDYANKFHHDTNPAYQTQSINDQELLSYCVRTIQFARRA
jgi:wobble nucleotide-excising tRNase